MYRCYLPLKDELVVGVDDNRLELRAMGHQPQIILVTGGCVEGLHRQPAVDEGHDNTAVPWFFQTVNQADVAIVYTDAIHRLATYSDKVRGFGTLSRFQAFGALCPQRQRKRQSHNLCFFCVSKIIYSNNAECGEICHVAQSLYSPVHLISPCCPPCLCKH